MKTESSAWYDCTNRKPYPHNPAYLVAKDGTVWRTRFRNGKTTRKLDVPVVMKQKLRSGYPAVGLWNNASQKVLSVHVMVLETFVGDRPGANFDAAHKDGNRLNPRLDNLEWTTKSANNCHKRLHGTMPCGEKSGTAKLTDSAVRTIRLMKNTGCSSVFLARRYGVHPSTIRRVANGTRWPHAPLRANGIEVE